MPRRLTASLAAAAILLAACGPSNAESERSDNAASTPPAAHGQTARVPTQLQFSAKTLDGQPFSGESLSGRPSVLWFWAPWCPRCQRDAPTVAQVAAANAAVTFVGVAARAQLSDMRSFVDTYRLGGITQLDDTDGTIWARFGVTHQPAYAFVDSKGSVDVVKDSMPESQLTERVRALAAR
ncbi:redoxin domain-containing protein [Mycobacterium kyorinense]|uniref:Soluble secreted antigen MPT53 n=1 Tax=Mycobacterium kyorinense TaxID=487514 RepID=A0A1X1YK18_9MYCO|nr:redoxin domain-containing protein [Mycobacterium kyorinense]ORW11404.1 disulfide bond formation protein DsbF [Mycobacterium kyorinense]